MSQKEVLAQGGTVFSPGGGAHLADEVDGEVLLPLGVEGVADLAGPLALHPVHHHPYVHGGAAHEPYGEGGQGSIGRAGGGMG